MKKCSKCKIQKNLNEFHKDPSKKDGIYSSCKTCHKIYRIKNTERLIAYRKIYRINNIDYLKQYDKQYSKLYKVKKRKIDVNFKLRCILRERLNKTLKNNYKSGSAVRDLGCTIEQFKVYLESKFTEGMNWNNYGRAGWHIDHIIPLSGVDLTNREELLKACHYTNLQPLWAKDNIKKGHKS